MVWKHIGVIMAALTAAFATYFALSPLFGYVVEQEYMTDAKEQERIEAALESFKSFVEENQISSTDMESVFEWVKNNDNIKLMLLGVDSETVPDTQKYDYSIVVEFADPPVLVAVQDYSEVLYLIGDVLAVGAALLIFIVLVIIYYQSEIARIMRLSRDVKAIAGGDLQGRIH